METEDFKPEDIVDEVFACYEKHGNDDYIGEPVSQLEHMSQAAAFAIEEGFDQEVVLAAFFHDIGHLCADGTDIEDMDGLGNVGHEQLGASYLRRLGFSERLATLVESHVIAKRYLTFKDPGYYNQLSEASKQTLAFQGGPMNEQEAIDFEKHPDAKLFVRLRYWDDQAKEVNVPVANISYLRSLAINHLIKMNNSKITI